MTHDERIIVIKLANSLQILSGVVNKLTMELPVSQTKLALFDDIQKFVANNEELYALMRKEWIDGK